MKEQSLPSFNPHIADGLLDKFVAFSRKLSDDRNRKLSLMNDFLDHFSDALKTNYRIQSTSNTIFAELLSEFVQQVTRIQKENHETSFLFNPLHFFNIGETLHSRMLAFLLNPHAAHGQGKLFLQKFLNQIDFEFIDDCRWRVSAELGRVDIMIRRDSSHSVVLIENKSNWAVDQPHQLYRYWYSNIFLPCTNLGLNWRDRKRYRIIYLTPSAGKLPVDQSLCRPPEYPCELPASLSEIDGMVDVWTFSDQINKWITASLLELEGHNHRMREFLLQYSELWN